jgi:serine/threonine protein kinase
MRQARQRAFYPDTFSLQREDILTHNAAKFYTASLLLSLEVVHGLGYIHRDIKPDNLLIGSDGHLRLTDFGLCKPFDASLFSGVSGDDPSSPHAPASSAAGPSAAMKSTWNFKRRTLAYSSVGTPDYIAPEVLRKVGYGPEADLWGVGCVLFEMLCGFPPFFSDDAHTTCRKIVQWRSCFKFPTDVTVDPQAQSLIRQLLCDGADRLSIAACKVRSASLAKLNRTSSLGLQLCYSRHHVGLFCDCCILNRCQAHPFLADIPWDDVHMLRPPFVPGTLRFTVLFRPV